MGEFPSWGRDQVISRDRLLMVDSRTMPGDEGASRNRNSHISNLIYLGLLVAISNVNFGLKIKNKITPEPKNPFLCKQETLY